MLGETYHIKGMIYERLSKPDLAINFFTLAIETNPQIYEARTALGYCQLRIKNFIEGWENYEFRIFQKDHALNKKNLDINSWFNINKQDSLLILKEQGIGDHIFFAGFLNELKKRSNFITVELDKRLINLFERSFENINFVEKILQNEFDDFYKVIPLGSIAKFFRRSLDDFRNTEYKYLKVDELRANEIKKNIKFKNSLKIGISWRSQGKSTGDIRTLNFEQFIKIFESKNISIINLQYGNIENDIALIDGSENYEFINYHEIDNYKDIDGLACLIEICDIVITVDNITAHLAGALGKKTWILLPTYSDFRWMEKTSECVWYKNVRLFRQESMGNWDFVTSNIKKMLEDFINNEFLQ